MRNLSSEAFERALDALCTDRDAPRRRVVITGMGAITPVGHDVEESWEHLLAGQSGIDYVTLFDASPYPTRIAAEVKDWDPTRYLPRKEARRMARCSQMALGAAHQALDDAGLPTGEDLGERAAVVIGTGLGGFEIYQDTLMESFKRGAFRVRPMAAVGGLPNMPAFHISQRFGAQGPLNTVVTACAAGTQAIGEGVELIRSGAADIVLAGGVEALIGHMFFAGFTSMKAISTSNDPPQKASRPFDRTRDGFVIGEGAAVFVLEELEHALARGARIYAEVLGHSASADAFHVAAPEPEGRGAQRAMRWALLDAGVEPDEVDYINAHGTSTPLNDKTETYAIKQVFGEHAYELAVNSTKSMIGHAFGGAGAIEAIAVTKSVQEDRLHPTINLEHPDPECDLDYVPEGARETEVNVALSNSFGLGGQNACLVIGKFRN
ncbi:MAG: beta-ketoacyl-ACP synthase II [Chloroflexi bacterium]|nr:beta-ketoacyl-ACP synthase II [Chloroflexota bacterium]